jgi:hypothetical protein
MTDEQTIADLRKTIEVLRRDGWTKGTYHAFAVEDDNWPTRPCHCVQGALATAVHPEEYLWATPSEEFQDEGQLRWDRANLALVTAIADSYRSPVTYWSSDRWNDGMVNSAEEVIMMLERAIMMIEAGKVPWHRIAVS